MQQSDHSFPLVILFGLILLNEVSLITPPYCVVILVNGQCEFVFVCSSPVLFSPSPLCPLAVTHYKDLNYLSQIPSSSLLPSFCSVHTLVAKWAFEHFLCVLS